MASASRSQRARSRAKSKTNIRDTYHVEQRGGAPSNQAAWGPKTRCWSVHYAQNHRLRLKKSQPRTIHRGCCSRYERGAGLRRFFFGFRHGQCTSSVWPLRFAWSGAPSSPLSLRCGLCPSVCSVRPFSGRCPLPGQPKIKAGCHVSSISLLRRLPSSG